MEKHLEEFLLATQRCTEQLREMIPQEQEKYQALISDNIEQIEAMVQNQQASIMKLKSLEAARLRCQEEAGFGGQNADQILQALPPQDKEAFDQCFTELRKAAEELHRSNNKAMEIARTSTVFWESMEPRAKAAAAAAGPVTYSGKVTYGANHKGQPAARIGTGALFQKKI